MAPIAADVFTSGQSKHCERLKVHIFTFSRTHVYLVTLCVIFGARAELPAQHPHQFLWPGMRSLEDAGGDVVLQGGSIIYISRVRGRRRVERNEGP